VTTTGTPADRMVAVGSLSTRDAAAERSGGPVPGLWTHQQKPLSLAVCLTGDSRSLGCKNSIHPFPSRPAGMANRIVDAGGTVQGRCREPANRSDCQDRANACRMPCGIRSWPWTNHRSLKHRTTAESSQHSLVTDDCDWSPGASPSVCPSDRNRSESKGIETGVQSRRRRRSRKSEEQTRDGNLEVGGTGRDSVLGARWLPLRPLAHDKRARSCPSTQGRRCPNPATHLRQQPRLATSGRHVTVQVTVTVSTH
jgi:hypothetical protein